MPPAQITELIHHPYQAPAGFGSAQPGVYKASTVTFPNTAALREERRARFMAVAEAVSIAKLQRRVGATMQVLVDHAPALGRKGGIGRSYADAPEIDGTVKLLAPEKTSKTLKVGEFTRARIVAADGHDLVAMPI